ncbi:SatD family protein [Halospeciosus flavus]|uniref:SatD family protein n=2 Tax=Halospeciosus flavus TaxID=3032283 RepID=A0ABD5Z4U3_9EURY|nr:SatD family protein [Halospeciosus flavus]
MRELYVVLGDVVRSRAVDDREAFRERLETACEDANDVTEGVVAPFSVLKGIDEIGGVLDRASDVYRIARSVATQLRPHRIRLAVARGTVDVGLETGDVARMDGGAFHEASDLLERVEREGLYFDLRTGRRSLDTSVADVVNLLLEQRHEWTDRQREVAERYRELGAQQAVADELDVSQQAVSRTLQQASWPLVSTVEERLQRTLDTAYGVGA